MDIVSIPISVVVGGVGGNLAGAILKNFSLGTIGNTIAGVVGGGVGGSVLSSLTGMDTSGTDVMGLVGAVCGSVVGGGGLLAIIGIIRNMLGGNKGG